MLSTVFVELNDLNFRMSNKKPVQFSSYGNFSISDGREYTKIYTGGVGLAVTIGVHISIFSVNLLQRSLGTTTQRGDPQISSSSIKSDHTRTYRPLQCFLIYGNI